MTPLRSDGAPARNTFEYLEITYIARNQKLESLTYISATGSTGLCLLLLTQLVSKSNALSQKVLAENGF